VPTEKDVVVIQAKDDNHLHQVVALERWMDWGYFGEKQMCTPFPQVWIPYLEMECCSQWVVSPVQFFQFLLSIFFFFFFLVVVVLGLKLRAHTC
jgi:hypothetical protein